MVLKINALTEFVSKLRVDADELSDKNQRITAVDNLIEKFPMNELSDFDHFERRFKRMVLNQELLMKIWYVYFFVKNIKQNRFFFSS